MMVRITKPLWRTRKVVVMESIFCVLEGFISIVDKGAFGLELK